MRKIVLARAWPVVAALFVLLGLTGCLTQKINVVVNPDGSGNIVMTQLFTPEAVAMMEASVKQVQEQMGGMTDGMDMQGEMDKAFYDEKSLKARARAFGSGVEFVKAQKIEQDGARGAVAVYSFKDVNQVRLPVDEENFMMTMSPGARYASDEEDSVELGDDDVVRFAMPSGERRILKLDLPPSFAVAPPAGTNDIPAEAEASDEETEEEEGYAVPPMMPTLFMPTGADGKTSEKDMMKALLKGLRLVLSVEIKGQALAATAQHPSPEKPGRFVLLDLDFDKMPAAIQVAGQIEEGDFDDVFATLASLPGAVIETNRQVTIEFK